MRRFRVLLSVVALLALIPCAAPAQQREPVTVRIGLLSSATDAPLWLAEELGYFREEGIAPQFLDFNSGEAMVAPLATGQLDVGAGSPAASLYNAVARGVGVRIVANLGTDAPGYGFEQMLVRTALVKSGRYKSPRDIRGMTVATNAHGSPSSPQVARFLAKYGLGWNDVKHVYLSYPNHVVALTNGSVDVTSTIEPFATNAIRSGAATKIEGNDAFYPDQELSVLMYGVAFTRRRDVAERFMRAYIRGARYYADALANGRLAGKNADVVIALLARRTKLHDPAMLRAITPTAVDVNGGINLASLRSDFAWFKKEGLIEGNVTADRVVDTSFAREAVRALGPYKKT